MCYTGDDDMRGFDVIICLNGPPGAGKTTLTNYLVDQYGVSKMDLTLPFKNFVADCFNISKKELETFKDADTNGTSYREICIKIADALEDADPNVWVKMVSRTFVPGTGIHILDSIGKRCQWEWIKNNIAGKVVLWSVSDGNSMKIVNG